MILVTGATGFVGANLVKELSKTQKIRCLVRRGVNLGKNIELVKGDLRNADSLEEATKNVSTVIHLAAIIKSNKKEEFERINVKGTKNLVNACRKNGVKRFVHMSSYDAVYKDKSDYAFSKWGSENVVKNSGLNYVIIRPMVIYGKGDKENLGMLFNMIKKYPFAPVIGNGNYKLQPVYIEDLVKVLIKCLDLDKVNKTYFVAGPEALTFNEIIDKTSELLSKKTIKLHVPLSILKILLKPYEMLSKNPAITYKKLLLVTENKTCSISETIKDFGFKPISFEEGVKKTLN